MTLRTRRILLRVATAAAIVCTAAAIFLPGTASATSEGAIPAADAFFAISPVISPANAG